MSAKKSQRDKLTGLLGRKALDEALKKELAAAKEGGAPVAVAVFDLDFFKRFNDAHGHGAGDQALTAMATVIRESAPEGALVGRYGGEEFVMVFPDAEREEAFLAAERVRGAMSKARKFDAEEGAVEETITVSGGVAAYPTDGRGRSELLRSAHEALFRAKETGRNRVCIARDTKMVTKTTHYTTTQLERLKNLGETEGVGEAVLLREALDDLLVKYKVRGPSNGG
jgi:diguanylate cyclase (GGDEF)-like protein